MTKIHAITTLATALVVAILVATPAHASIPSGWFIVESAAPGTCTSPKVPYYTAQKSGSINGGAHPKQQGFNISQVQEAFVSYHAGLDPDATRKYIYFPATPNGVIYSKNSSGTNPTPVGTWATLCNDPPENPCANPSKNAKAVHVDATSLSAQVDYCLNGCLLRVAKDAYNVHLPGSVADRRTAWGTWVGQQCVVGPTQPEQALEKKNVDGTDGACLADGKSCISREKKNCGYVNGEYRCVTANQLTPENPCVTTASGAMFCRADATTPPKPDNGTPGQPATPDTKFDLKDPTLFGSPSDVVGVHYFKPSTVKGDSNDAGGDADGDGRCEEGEAGSKDCTPLEGGGDCQEGEECGNGASFRDPAGEYGYEDLSGEIDQARQNITDALDQVRAEAAGMFGDGPNGSGGLPCPEGDIAGAHVSLCLSQYEQQLSPIAAFVMLGASIAAAMIILGGKN